MYRHVARARRGERVRKPVLQGALHQLATAELAREAPVLESESFRDRAGSHLVELRVREVHARGCVGEDDQPARAMVDALEDEHGAGDDRGEDHERGEAEGEQALPRRADARRLLAVEPDEPGGDDDRRGEPEDRGVAARREPGPLETRT